MNHEELFVGIDISKSKHDIAVINEQGMRCAPQLVIQENRQGYHNLNEYLQRLFQQAQPCRVYIGMEATGDYWKNIYHYLLNPDLPWGVPVSITVINPLKTKAFATAKLQRARTDAIDAHSIAQFMAEKKPPATVVPEPGFEILKDLDRQIYAYKKQVTMTSNKLRLELYKVAPELELALPSLQGQQILALLSQYPTAEMLAQTPCEVLYQLRYGLQERRISTKMIQEVQALVHQSIAHKTGPGAGLVVQSLIRNMQNLQQEITSLQEQIGIHYHQVRPDINCLTSIPGISTEMACILEAYIGDVNRFSNAKQVVAYFGMNPIIHDSGYKTKVHHYALQKKGDGHVRHKLYMIVLNQIRLQKNQFYRYYRRQVDRGKPKMVAIVATMRKLLVTIYSLLKNHENFDPDKI